MKYDQIRNNMLLRNISLAPYACFDKEAYRFYNVIDDDFRAPFYRDGDRIVYSLSYTRYMDKTQVFSFNENDNISKRMTHVQMVAKIARTIGRALRLNEDLIEAAALGHDLGHVPFGHAGERILDAISQEVGEGYFNHNIQSVRTLMVLENNGIGSNITLQVLDNYWMEHINTMSHLREGIHLRGYAQEDPLRAYTMEGFDLFDSMMQRIDKDVSIFLLKAEIKHNVERKPVAKKTMTNDVKEDVKKAPKRVNKIGRNDACPCGSGIKYKQCCGK